MTFAEKVLYHQIHPAKLATDIGAAVVSLYLLWWHHLALGLLVHFAPPVVASALLVPYARLEGLKNSRPGRYISWHMTRTVEATRLVGDIAMVFAAWYRSPLMIAAGLLVVIAAWAAGPLRRRTGLRSRPSG